MSVYDVVFSQWRGNLRPPPLPQSEGRVPPISGTLGAKIILLLEFTHYLK